MLGRNGHGRTEVVERGTSSGGLTTNYSCDSIEMNDPALQLSDMGTTNPP